MRCLRQWPYQPNLKLPNNLNTISTMIVQAEVTNEQFQVTSATNMGLRSPLCCRLCIQVSLMNHNAPGPPTPRPATSTASAGANWCHSLSGRLGVPAPMTDSDSESPQVSAQNRKGGWPGRPPRRRGRRARDWRSTQDHAPISLAKFTASEQRWARSSRTVLSESRWILLVLLLTN